MPRHKAQFLSVTLLLEVNRAEQRAPFLLARAMQRLITSASGLFLCGSFDRSVSNWAGSQLKETQNVFKIKEIRFAKQNTTLGKCDYIVFVSIVCDCI